MATKLKVEELRTELSKRGLSVKGTKATLVQRFESVIEEERKSTDGSVGKKREREAAAMVDGSASKKIKPIEELQEMGIRELREQAILRGVSPSGSKKKLLEMLCAEIEEKEENGAKNEEKEEEEEPVRLKEEVSAKTNGTAELDQYLPDDIKTQYHVFEQDNEFYDAMLNQTNVGDNNNKFYAIQLLESNDGSKKFMVYSRWGRVGSKGQDKLQGPYASKEAAVKDFCTKFFSKTKNQWTERRDFVSYPKCYTWLEMDYSKDQESKVESVSVSTIENQLDSTKLDPRIAKFIALICNTSMMEQQMMILGFNPSKLPLGKLSKSTILKGYGVLKKISEMIDKNDKKMLEELSGEFYTVIPHDFGFRKMREWIIDTPLKLKAKLELVEALGEIELANGITKDDKCNKEDPLLSHYRCLRCELIPLEVDSAEFSLIESYIKNTGLGYKVDITQLFRASREGEDQRFKKFSQTKNRMLLWHGSGLANWVGILSQGLRIAPPEAPPNGYAFGKGIYFADMFSKSAGYSNRLSTPDGVLVLCEVALGEVNELLKGNCRADKLLNGKLSTKGVGQTYPDPAEACILEDGVIVPKGNPLTIEDVQCACWQNEYIVYDVDQVRIRYVVHVNFGQC